MSDFLQDADGDLVIQNGALVLFTDAQLEVAQRVTQRLRTFFGEWFLDTTVGVPWIQQIFQKGTNIGIIEALVKQAIVGTPGVLQLTAFNMSLGSNRTATITFQARSVSGNVDVTVTV